MRNHIPAPPHPDVQKMMEKFPETYQIVMMYKYFRSKSGENGNIKLDISMKEIKDYVYEREGLKF